MQLLFRKKNIYINLIIGITWLILAFGNLFFKESLSFLDYMMMLLALYYLAKFYWRYKNQYLQVTESEIIKNLLFRKKRIAIDSVKRFYRNNVGDYVIEGEDKKIKINPISVNTDSLKSFKEFTRTLRIPKEIH